MPAIKWRKSIYGLTFSLSLPFSLFISLSQSLSLFVCMRTISLGQRSRSQSVLKFYALQNRVRPLTSSCMVGFENYLAQMVITTRQNVMCKNYVARSKVKVTACTYSLCIGLNETCSCPAHNFVIKHASGMM